MDSQQSDFLFFSIHVMVTSQTKTILLCIILCICSILSSVGAFYLYHYYTPTTPPTSSEQPSTTVPPPVQTPPSENVESQYVSVTFKRESNNAKCLDIDNGQGKFDANQDLNKSQVQVWDCTGSPNQQFYLDTATNRLRWKNKCVDPDMLAEKDGTKLQLWDCNDGNNGWKYENGLLSWRDKWCVDVSNGDDKNGNPLQIWTCNSASPNMRWTKS